ncbi:hypothetical protein QBC34DRAFT_387379 [Podospora aff. communis PSN243]|uniref:LIM zinc-binding domain-containing protein n=1 Tax=Podospora aff. communis PSN243 TaxID=3040156 RepID=A0AAV9G4J6_9PEZI|nr:hypothetical protein QBC34DRAFT_387379 [Podospora aff. communis PSN243]
MDPISIASIVASTTGTCLTTIKKLYDLQEKYQDTPVIIVAICSESTVISASLAQIQGLLLQRQDLAHVWKSQHTEMPLVLDQALTGCMVVFSCLDAEIQRITAGAADVSRIRWRSRARMVWNESHLNDLLSSMRGQQTAITTLIQLLQMNTLAEIKDMLLQKQEVVRASAHLTQSLRSRNPSVMVANSIYAGRRESSIIWEGDAVSVVAPSDLDFEFDDLIINSQAYRRALARARARTHPKETTEPSVEELGGLIDLSDALTIGQSQPSDLGTPAALDDLEGLVLNGPLTRTRTMETEKPVETAETALDCNEITAEKFLPHEGLFLCEFDYFRRLDLICHVCGKALRASYITVSNKKYHLDHFGCCVANCPVRFGPSDDYIEYKNAPYCQYHYSTMHARHCAGCEYPILLRFVEYEANDREGRDQPECWHPECDMMIGRWGMRWESMGGTHLKRIQGQWGDEHGVVIEDPDEFVSRMSAIDTERDKLFSILDGYYRLVSRKHEVFQKSRQGPATDLIASGRDLAGFLSVLFEGLDSFGLQTSREITSHRGVLSLFVKAIRTHAASNGPRALWSIGAPTDQQLQAAVEKFSKRIIVLLRAGVQACGKSASGENPSLDGFLRLLKAFELGAPLASEAAKVLGQDLDLPTAAILNRSQLEVCEVCHKSIKDDRDLVHVSLDSWGGGPYWHFACLECDVCEKPAAYSHHWELKKMPGRFPAVECMSCGSPPVGEYYLISEYGRVVFMMYEVLRFLKDNGGSPVVL